jgi:hypothetical protein
MDDVRSNWLLKFVEAVRELRPHLGDKFINTVGEIRYSPEVDPARSARDYHELMESQRTAVTKRPQE